VTPVEPAGALTRSEKHELLREMLAQKIASTRTAQASFAQERLWFLDRMQPGSAGYNLSAAWRITGTLSPAVLERALGEMVRRHESLRTTFAEADGVLVQVIAPFEGFALAVEDLSALGAPAREAAVERRTREALARPFDLRAGPLFHARLLRLGAEAQVLLLCMHHVVSDGWSIGVLFRELWAVYAALREGRPSPLPQPATQYADYAEWQRAQLRGQALEGELGWWRERLAGAPALLALPTDRPRPAVRTEHGAREWFEVAAPLRERLELLGRRAGATPFMVLLAAFQVLLAKYAGSDDVVVGTPVAGRTRRELEGLIGFFVNTLVLRTDLGGDPTFGEVLRRVREATLSAFEHQEVPFEKLVEALQPERSLSHAPLFQVTFTLGNAERPGGAPAGLEIEKLDRGGETSKFDLMLHLSPQPQGLRGALTYSTELFERGTAVRMIAHLKRVLEQVAANPDVRLSRLELAGSAERRLVLHEWNRTDAEHPAESCIHLLFEAQAARTPEAVALAFDGGTVTFRELDARANRLARRLIARGVGPEARVGIRLERGPEMVVAILAVLKAGGAYVPLDPGHPAERLERMLADAGAAVLLTRGHPHPVLSLPAGVQLLDLDGERDAIAAEPADAPECGAGPRNLAYVIFTSGSTGRPKGVGVEHRALVSHMGWFIRELGLGADDRVLQKTPLGFDAAGWEVFAPLLTGGRLVLAAHEGERDPRYLARAVRAGGITALQLVPSLLRVLLDEPELARCTSLRQVFCGGEALPGELVRRLADVLPHARLINLYGPTECCIDSSLHRCGEEDARAAVVPIGRPVPNTRSYVLDAAMRAAPVGVPGELYVGGVQVARGYLGRPALTAERFLPDPYSREPGARLYRTGDRARWKDVTASAGPSAGPSTGPSAGPSAEHERSRIPALTHFRTGVLEYLGRADQQVKIRGVRIEPGEIEAVLRGHPDVSACAVVAREDAAGEDTAGDARLVAYVVGVVDGEALRAHAGRSLPACMVPAVFVPLDALPLTPNGKLDRRALPAPDPAAGEAPYTAPRTPVEEVLAEMWASLLRVERVGVHENFFALGGHSLLATRLAARVSDAFGVELPVRAVFEGATVAEVARAVEALRRADAPALPPVVPVERGGPLPLSFAQERLWFLHRLQPESAFYNVGHALRLSGALDVRALERALGEVVRRHEVLRTTFADAEGTPVQAVAPFGGFALPAEDVAGGEAEARRRTAEEVERPFDLAAGPLFRARLLRLATSDHLLLLSMHHVVTDEWSTGVLFRELSALYAAYRDGADSPLPELAVQYADYAAWERAEMGGERLERQLAWWKERLAGAPALLELPTDRPRPAVQTHRGAQARIQLPATLLERLQALGRGEGATPFMVLLAAFQALLARYGGSDDVVVGSPIAGRTRREVEGLIGFFVNTLVLRADLGGDPTFREALRRVREVTLGAYENQDVPFERLVAELRPERTLSHSPLFQVMFIQGGAEPLAVELPGVEVRRAGGGSRTSKFDLTLVAATQPDGLALVLEYGTELFERATAERMLGHLRRVLEQVAADADTHLSRLELLDDGERRLLVGEWSGAEAHAPTGRLVHHRFEARAAQAPDAVAVAFGDRSLTCAELNERANRLAHRLVRLGVGADARVGICLERGPEMIVCVLAVLKAGGACVPLDPGYPAERLAFMVADAGAPVLLTQDALRNALPAPDGVRVLAVDAEWPEIAAEAADDLAAAPRAGDLAYVLYTSGSTGTPKGVMMPHEALSALVAWHLCGAELAEPRRTLQFASLSFDVSFQEIAVTLASGGTLVLVDDDTRRDAVQLARYLAAQQVERLFLPFVALQALAEAARETGTTLGLREIVTAGEQLVSTPQIAALVDGLPGCRLINHYGPTETHVATAHTLAGGSAAWSPLPPIGRPVAGTRVFVLDGALRPAPVGVPGELYVGGAQVARGYLDRPALTAQRFVPDPFTPGARLYATGDRVRWKADGEMEYLGRADQQVKIRGFRVEPGEVEAVLRQHADVRDCAVVARGDAPGQTRLVAYVVGAADADALRAHLRARLPEHMVPSAFVALDALPLTPSGKLDRRALPAPDAAADGEGFVRPRDPTEEALAAIWAEVLRREAVGVHDDFFDLGGHSLLATRVAARVRTAFGVALTVRALFQNRTIEALARHLAERGARAPTERTREAAPSAGASPHRLLADLGSLSEEELDRLLAAQP
jgi:amino acid adenylation domain-containing protein